MSCVSPLRAWRSKDGHPQGKVRLVFKEALGIPNTEMLVACGQCIGCRLDKSKDWALRCVHEAKQYEKNCFITLTYNEQNLPKDRSLVKEHYTLFMKRLRKKYGSNIRFFMCGEYGTEGGRPHYHACIFNHDFDDKELYTVRDNIPLYQSNELKKLWPYGFSTIGAVTFESAAYVSRYVTKKLTGIGAAQEDDKRIKEYGNMSRRPGIGKIYFDKFHRDAFAIDGVIRNGLKYKLPKYYDRLYNEIDPDNLKLIKERRQKRINSEEMQGYRLRCKERILNRKLTKLKRGYENEKNLCNP